MTDDRPPLLILDACCAINLLATDRVAEIVGAQSARVAVADVVLESEVLRLPPEHEGDIEDTSAARERVLTLRPLVEDGTVGVLSLASEEETASFVSLALRLDDGEALSASLAIHRGGILATDDRKAIRVVSETAPDLAVVRTTHVLRTWVDVASLSDPEVREVLRRVERDASFVPPTTDPNAGWWRRASGAVPGDTRTP